MIAFGGRRGPHRSGSRCRGRPIERREAGREGCLWPNAASQGRPPDGSGGESERSTQNGRAKTLCGGGGGGGAHTNSELPQAGFPESGEVWLAVFRPLSSGNGAMAVALSRRVLSRPLARAALRPLGTAAAEVEQSFSLALSEEQQAFKDAVRLLPLPTHTITAAKHPTTTTGRHASLRRRR